jgi:hypothetical protein
MCGSSGTALPGKLSPEFKPQYGQRETETETRKHFPKCGFKSPFPTKGANYDVSETAGMLRCATQCSGLGIHCYRADG